MANKGTVVEEVLSKMAQEGTPADFVLCVGDDKSDEEMFKSLSKQALPGNPEIFSCSVGQKPSNAKFFLDDTKDVQALIRGLACLTTGEMKSRSTPHQVEEVEGSVENNALEGRIQFV